jgi:hyperpolarization activated cyclic nucleotide-gated potassium channel 3
VVVKPAAIAQRYLRSWFVIDLVATLPLDYVLNATGDSSGNAAELTRLARLPRALRLLRLLRLAKVARMGQMRRVLRWVKSDIHPAFIRLLSSSFWAALILHLFAGIWFMIGDQEPSNEVTWISYYGYDVAPVRARAGRAWY